MSNTSTSSFADTQASHLSVQACPDRVFVRMKAQSGDAVRRQMFAELTLGEAVRLRAELDACIAVAAASRFP